MKYLVPVYLRMTCWSFREWAQLLSSHWSVSNQTFEKQNIGVSIFLLPLDLSAFLTTLCIISPQIARQQQQLLQQQHKINLLQQQIQVRNPTFNLLPIKTCSLFLILMWPIWNDLQTENSFWPHSWGIALALCHWPFCVKASVLANCQLLSAHPEKCFISTGL